MWTAIKYVGFALALIAFLSALIAWLYGRSRFVKRERLIKNAAEDQRAELVERVLIIFNEDADGLTREGQYDLALTRLGEKAKRFKIITAGLLVIAALAATPAIVAMLKVNPPTPGNLFGKIEGVEMVTVQDESVQLFIHLSITNMDSPTTVGHYAVRINSVNSKSIEYKGPPEEINAEYSIPQADGKQALVIKPQDSIIRMTGQSIGKEQKVSGWLMLSLPLPGDVLRQAGIRYTVSFADANGETYQAGYEVR